MHDFYSAIRINFSPEVSLVEGRQDLSFSSQSTEMKCKLKLRTGFLCTLIISQHVFYFDEQASIYLSLWNMQIVSRIHSLLISFATQICSTLCSSSFKVFRVIKVCFLYENFFLWHSLLKNIPTLHLSNSNLKKSVVNKL